MTDVSTYLSGSDRQSQVKSLRQTMVKITTVDGIIPLSNDDSRLVLDSEDDDHSGSRNVSHQQSLSKDYHHPDDHARQTTNNTVIEFVFIESFHLSDICKAFCPWLSPNSPGFRNLIVCFDQICLGQ